MVLKILVDGTNYPLWLVIIWLYIHKWISNYLDNFIAFKVGAVVSTSQPKDNSVIQNDNLAFLHALYTRYLGWSLWKDQGAEFPSRFNPRLKCGVSQIFKYFQITNWKSFANSKVYGNDLWLDMSCSKLSVFEGSKDLRLLSLRLEM